MLLSADYLEPPKAEVFPNTLGANNEAPSVLFSVLEVTLNAPKGESVVDFVTSPKVEKLEDEPKENPP